MSDMTYSANQDGSISIVPEGKTEPVRYVMESDLLAVKGSLTAKSAQWETDKTGLQAQLAEANRLKNESHQTLLTERTAHEQFVDAHKDYDDIKTKMGELETEKGSLTERVGNMEKEITDRVRQSLTVTYGVPEDKLKDKDLDQLRSLEQAATELGITNGGGNKPARFAGNPPPSGGGGSTSLDRAKEILSAHREGGGNASNLVHNPE